MVITQPIPTIYPAFKAPQAFQSSLPIAPMATSLILPTTDNHAPHPTKPVPTNKQRLASLGKAGALIGGALLLKRLPKTPSAFQKSLVSSDWKEWARVMLAIGGFGQAQKAANWEPPVWLNAMLNVALVTPLVTRFNVSNVLQGLIIAPFVGAFAGLNHYVSEKAEKPLQEKLHIPPLASRIFFSALTTVTGILTISKIPPAAKSWPGSNTAKGTTESASRTAIGSTCVNGCCASVVCANDIGQMGSAMLDSYQSRKTKETHSA